MILAVVLIPPYCDPRGIWVIDGDTLRYFGEESEVPAKNAASRAVRLLRMQNAYRLNRALNQLVYWFGCLKMRPILPNLGR
jgi:hypothetical protein